MSTHVPGFQSFFSHNSVMANLATSSIRVKSSNVILRNLINIKNELPSWESILYIFQILNLFSFWHFNYFGLVVMLPGFCVWSRRFQSLQDPKKWVGLVTIHVCGIVECCLWYFCNWKTQGLSQDLEIGCPKLAMVNFLGVKIFKGDHNILRFQPLSCMNLLK